MTWYLDLSHDKLIRLWRCLVRCEIFERLELTHTCVRFRPTIHRLPEEDRLEIEEEEEELYLQLEELMNEFDEWLEEFNGDIADCVDIFFDRLDLSKTNTTSFDFGPTLERG